IDPALHRVQILERAEVEVAAMDEGRELAEEALAERQVAGDGSRLQPDRALPRLSEGLVVRERRRERDGEGSFPPSGPEPEVDAKAAPFLRHLAEGTGQLLGEANEPLAARSSLPL